MSPRKFRLASIGLTVCLLTVGTSAADQSGGPQVVRCPGVPDDVEIDPSSLDKTHELLKDAPRIVFALGKGRRAYLKQLLKSGADPNVCALGSSLLNISVMSGDIDEVRLLLDAGAETDLLTDASGATPLHIALEYGQFDIARLLLKRGANPLAKRDSRQSALHALAMSQIVTKHRTTAKQRIEMSALMLSKGVELNAQDVQGTTPLMWAALAGDRDLVQFLLARGADASVKNKRGKTAVDLARSKQHMEVVADLVAVAAASSNSLPAAKR